MAWGRRLTLCAHRIFVVKKLGDLGGESPATSLPDEAGRRLGRHIQVRHEPVKLLVQFCDRLSSSQERRLVRVDPIQDVILAVAHTFIFLFNPLHANVGCRNALLPRLRIQYKGAILACQNHLACTVVS